ncbi:zinc ribbon domain-containing protein [Nocardioides sp. IC4_145]|uniref:zinc ribbon domain-containing protein n=1 Tax=Nocardioides sp. IC4_145 TaxID=2714037 RepID=UPI00140991FC|nr:zinc ribbon domain-containing protein [Nocardioides sp. IC4_145]NHC22556.1 zinc ribbon domain-containing protein [Nocardioides sp. IC4_145]
MENCTACGARLGPGRSCPACGHPVEAPDLSDWRTDTAERPALRDVPLAPRYPLYADEAPAPAPPGSGGRRRGWLPWAAGSAALLLVAGLGTALLVGGADEQDPAPVAESASPPPAASSSSAPPPAQPTRSAQDDISRKPEPREPEDVTASAGVRVPATAPPSRDLDGTRTSYDAGNLVDGDRSTTWRMRGDATGRQLVLRLDRPTTITRVGLVNGYAKRARGPRGGVLDWYTGNRRVLAVEWVLDDGTVVRQRLDDVRRVQTVEVGAITTRRVRLRLVEVSAPGSGRAGRDYTAISEVSVVGLPG